MTEELIYKVAESIWQESLFCNDPMESSTHKYERLAKAAISAIGQQSGWRADVQNAPRDGQPVLFWDGEAIIGYPQEGCFIIQDRTRLPILWRTGGVDSESIFPTRWQPIVPPEPNKQEG